DRGVQHLARGRVLDVAVLIGAQRRPDVAPRGDAAGRGNEVPAAARRRVAAHQGPRAHQQLADHAVDVQRLHAVPDHWWRPERQLGDAAGVHLQDRARKWPARLRLGDLAATPARQPGHRRDLHPSVEETARVSAFESRPSVAMGKPGSRAEPRIVPVPPPPNPVPRMLRTLFAYVGVCLLVVFFALPMLWLVVTPFAKKPTYALNTSGFTWHNFQRLFQDPQVGPSLGNSLYLAVGSSLLVVVLASLAAYALSR